MMIKKSKRICNKYNLQINSRYSWWIGSKFIYRWGIFWNYCFNHWNLFLNSKRGSFDILRIGGIDVMKEKKYILYM